MSKRRSGRGRLSAIEQLPPESEDIIVWAAKELAKRERTQREIYEEFYLKLEELQRDFRGELEFKIPSMSAFNRYSIKQAHLTRRLEDTRAIASSIATNFDAEASDDLTLIAAEAIKTLTFEILTDAGESGIAPKDAMSLANALRAACQAQGVSTQRRQKVEKEFAAKTREAVDKVAKVKGLTAETAESIKSQILGVAT
ncbi:hypothetical protein IWQ54_000193 [Labrenzia sp. EL_195]|uniref:DUF3486 family protein n=1 Tax=Roseibium album TaxID=311410 RepID=UPI0018C9B673|nr:DUF3486 family protein [Roseibium album]MBG6160543.1 hypothetical protein [Labrenzia sp. EL_195]MCR9057474.1 DUF3486 family protein [Paracoccaceae bacterium]